MHGCAGFEEKLIRCLEVNIPGAAPRPGSWHHLLLPPNWIASFKSLGFLLIYLGWPPTFR